MSEFEKRVSDTVEALRKKRGHRPEVLCVAAGISRASYYSRITQGGWRLAELERVADQLDTPLQDLLSGRSEFACTGIVLVNPHISMALAA